MFDTMKFGKALSTLRKEADLTQNEVADRLNLSRQAISKYERGESFPDISVLVMIAELFNVTLNELINYGEPTKGESAILKNVAKGDSNVIAENIADVVNLAPLLKPSVLTRLSHQFEKQGIDIIREALKGKTTALAGPSGVGKSSIFNMISPDFKMETGTVSDKIRRGKHTTRHSELIYIGEDTYIMDTPGFSSFYVEDLEKEDLKEFFYEFGEYEPYCKFQGCVHINEPVCGVKDALEEGKISQTRYENYKLLYEELKGKKKW
jgi:transcriptional regulator with XRE-family HTH domain